MAVVTIKEIYRDKITTQYGERENIKIIPEEDSILDINGDDVDLTLPDGKHKRISGFRDKNGETDKWVKGTKIKVQIAVKKGVGKQGDAMEWINFKLPEGVSSIVESPSNEEEQVVSEPVDPNDF